MTSGAVVWINGRLVDEAEASVPYNDHGLLVGDGVFETLKVVQGSAFAVTRHLARLRRSSSPLDLDVPDDSVLVAAMTAVIDAFGPAAGRIRITVTGGVGPLGSSRGDRPSTVIVAAAGGRPEEGPTDVITVPWPRNERSAVTGLKTISYAENVVALARAERQGASEAIFANTRGDVCEGTGSNIFIGLDGRLVTPPLSAGCLAGVTRELLIEATDVTEVDVAMSALSSADEAFLSSSTRDVQPIRSIDGRPLTPCPGPLTAAAAEAFTAAYGDVLDP